MEPEYRAATGRDGMSRDRFLCPSVDFEVEKGGEEAECGPSLFVLIVVNPTTT